VPLAFAHSIYLHSVTLDLTLEGAWTRAPPSASREEDTAAMSRQHHRYSCCRRLHPL